MSHVFSDDYAHYAEYSGELFARGPHPPGSGNSYFPDTTPPTPGTWCLELRMRGNKKKPDPIGKVEVSRAGNERGTPFESEETPVGTDYTAKLYRFRSDGTWSPGVNMEVRDFCKFLDYPLSKVKSLKATLYFPNNDFLRTLREQNNLEINADGYKAWSWKGLTATFRDGTDCIKWTNLTMVTDTPLNIVTSPLNVSSIRLDLSNRQFGCNYGFGVAYHKGRSGIVQSVKKVFGFGSESKEEGPSTIQRWLILTPDERNVQEEYFVPGEEVVPELE